MLRSLAISLRARVEYEHSVTQHDLSAMVHHRLEQSLHRTRELPDPPCSSSPSTPSHSFTNASTTDPATNAVPTSSCHR